MREKYCIKKAENGYYVEVYNENDGSERKRVFTSNEELARFLSLTIFSELKELDMLNVTMDYL